MGLPPAIQLALLALAALLLLAAVLRHVLRGRRLPYFRREFLLSKGEAAFFHALRKAAPAGLMAAPKVRLADVIGCDAAAWRAGFGGRVAQKHVAFVLVDAATTAIVLVIELDDRTHRQRDRRKRDDFVDRALASAGVPILHEPAAASYDWAKLRARLAGAIERSAAGRRAK